MPEITATRTLVKSTPELWAECSDADSLARHLNGTFGEIRITRLEPETAVAWEGEQFSGTVRLEPAGWGTKVVLTAVPETDPAPPEPAVQPPEAAAPRETAVAPAAPTEAAGPEPVRKGLFARVFGRFLRRAPGPELTLEPPEEIEPAMLAEPLGEEPVAPPAPGPEADLAAALESLGQAHHRPFSRG